MSLMSLPLKIYENMRGYCTRAGGHALPTNAKQKPFLPVYQAIMRQSRQAYLYGDRFAPDTFDGRFDVLVLHACLILRRLKREKTAHTRTAGQAVFDLLFLDMERVLREIGIGDLSVGKKIKKMAQAFYGRATAYDKALAMGDNLALLDVLQRNFYPEHDSDSDSDSDHEAQLDAQFGDYVRRVETYLDALPLEVILSRDIFAQFSQSMKGAENGNRI